MLLSNYWTTIELRTTTIVLVTLEYAKPELSRKLDSTGPTKSAEVSNKASHRSSISQMYSRRSDKNVEYSIGPSMHIDNHYSLYEPKTNNLLCGPSRKQTDFTTIVELLGTCKICKNNVQDMYGCFQ